MQGSDGLRTSSHVCVLGEHSGLLSVVKESGNNEREGLLLLQGGEGTLPSQLGCLSLHLSLDSVQVHSCICTFIGINIFMYIFLYPQ